MEQRVLWSFSVSNCWGLLKLLNLSRMWISAFILRDCSDLHVFDMIFCLPVYCTFNDKTIFTLISWQGKHFNYKLHLTSSEDTEQLPLNLLSWIDCQSTSTLHHKLLLWNTLFTHNLDQQCWRFQSLPIQVGAVCILHVSALPGAYLLCEWT